MSAWANATGKPQLTYAERLRRATQQSGSQSKAPSTSAASSSTPPSGGPSSRAGAAPTPAASSASTSSGVTASSTPVSSSVPIASLEDSSRPATAVPSSTPAAAPSKPTVVTSALAPSGSPSQQKAANVAPLRTSTVATNGITAATEHAMVPSLSSGTSSIFSTGSRQDNPRGSISIAPSSPLSSHITTASASVNGDDAASTTHSINTESSASATPSNSTAPTSVSSPHAAASSMLSSASSISNLSSGGAISVPGVATVGAVGSRLSGPPAQASSSSPAVNVWEVRKKAMMEKQRLQEETQRRSREQNPPAQAQDNKTSSERRQAGKHGSHAASTGQAATPTRANAASAPASSLSASGDRSNQARSSANQQGRGSARNAAARPLSQSTLTSSRGNGSTVSSGSSLNGPARSNRGHQLSSSGAPASNATVPSGSATGTKSSSRGNAKAPATSPAQSVGASSHNATGEDEAQAGARANTVESNGNEVQSVGASASKEEGEAILELNEEPRAKEIGADLSSGAGKHSTGESVGSEHPVTNSVRHTKTSSTLNGAAKPFRSPASTSRSEETTSVSHDEAGVPRTALPIPPANAGVQPSPTETVTPHSVASGADLPQSPLQTPTPVPASQQVAGAVDYDNAWLERIHMLNGGQNMPVYGPLTLASSKSRAEVERAEAETSASKPKAATHMGATKRDDALVDNTHADSAQASADVKTSHGVDAFDKVGSKHSPTINQRFAQQPPASEGSTTASTPTIHYLETRSKARRRSSAGHKNRKAGTAFSTVTPTVDATKKDAGATLGENEPSVRDDGGSASNAVTPGEDAQGWPIPLEARSADVALNKKAQAVPSSRGHHQSSSAATATDPQLLQEDSSTTVADASEPDSKLNNVNATSVPGKSGSNRAGPMKPLDTQITRALGTDAGAMRSPGAGGSSLSPRPAHLPATPPPSVTNGPTRGASPYSGVNGGGRGAYSRHGGTVNGAHPGVQGYNSFNGDQSNLVNGSGANGIPMSYSNPAMTAAMMMWNQGVGAAAPLVAGPGSIPGTLPGPTHPYHRPHRINKDGSFSPTRAVDYAATGHGGNHPSGPHGFQGADGMMNGSLPNGYGRGSYGGGKRGRGGRGGNAWRGTGMGGHGPRGREYSVSSVGSHNGGHGDVGHPGFTGVYDARYGTPHVPVMPGTGLPHVYYVPYPVPVPYASTASSSRAESVDAATTTDDGVAADPSALANSSVSSTSTPAPATSTPGSDAFSGSSDTGATPASSSTSADASNTGAAAAAAAVAAAGYWQQAMDMSAASYPYYPPNVVPFLTPAGLFHGMPNMLVPTAMTAVPPTPPDPVRAQALAQLDFYFSPRNLEGDFFLRQRMDSQGWVPIAVVAGFKKVRQITADVGVIRDAMLYSAHLEVDSENWRVRKRYGWEEYVLPVEQQVSLPLPSEHTGGKDAGTRDSRTKDEDSDAKSTAARGAQDVAPPSTVGA